MPTPQQRVIIRRQFFIYTLNFAALAAAATANDSVTIQADSEFHLYKLTYMADIAAAAQTDSTRVIPLCTILITDTGTGAYLSDAAVPIPAFFGDGRIPFILPRPRVFQPSATITGQANNYSAATTYNLYLQMIGEKVYYR